MILSEDRGSATQLFSPGEGFCLASLASERVVIPAVGLRNETSLGCVRAS